MNYDFDFEFDFDEEEFNDYPSFKEKHPDHIVISYINCTAAIKAMSDIICTSSNAISVVNSVPKDQKIIFAPDKNLGRYITQKTGREMVLWNGACMVHEIFSFEKITKLKDKHPEAKFIAHPECEEAVLQLADFIGLDVCLAILEVLHDGFGNPKYAPCPLLVNMVTAGKKGVKSGEGFYSWGHGTKDLIVADNFKK